MKIVLRGEQTGDIIADTLRNNGVVDVELLKNPNSKDDIHWSSYHNMLDMVKKFKELIEDNAEFVILVDADVDGFTSSYIIYKYLLNLGVKVRVVHHKINKESVLTEELVKEFKEGEVVIIPDAGSSDYDVLEELCLTNKIFIIDHHDIQDEERLYKINNVICVNNQSSKNVNSNPHLTGVGMSYRLLQGLDYTLNKKLADEHLFEVATGQVADVCNLVDNETRNLVMQGLKCEPCRLFKTILGSKKIILPKDISYELAPRLNALIRIGDASSMEYAYNVMCDIGVNWGTEQKSVKNRKTGSYQMKTVEYGDYVDVKKMLDYIKRKQRRTINYVKSNMDKPIKGGITIGIKHDKGRALSGLIAGELARDTDRPTLMLTYDDDRKCYYGSGRGKEGRLENFKEWLSSIDESIKVGGHGNAFGITCITEEAMEKIKIASNELAINEEKFFSVDAIINKLQTHDLEKIAKNNYLFGEGNLEPKIASKLTINLDKITYYEKSRYANIQMNGYSIVMFNLNTKIDIEEFLKNQSQGKTAIIQMVGTASRANFAGKNALQFIANDIEIEYLDFFF